MNLGYSVFFSLTFGTFFSVLIAYATHTSWIPDPRCRINVNNLARSKVNILFLRAFAYHPLT